MKLTDTQYTSLRDTYVERIVSDMTTTQLEEFVKNTYVEFLEGYDDEELIDEVNAYDVEIVRKVLN